VHRTQKFGRERSTAGRSFGDSRLKRRHGCTRLTRSNTSRLALADELTHKLAGRLLHADGVFTGRNRGGLRAERTGEGFQERSLLMNKLLSRQALLGFAYLNVMLEVIVWVASYRGPEFVGFLVALPLVVVAVLVPRFGVGRLQFPSRPGRFSGLLAVAYFVGVLLATMGERRLALLAVGETVTGISVRDVADHADAVAFEFTDGRGREELQGMASNTKSRGSDDWYVVPVVPENWTVRDPVTVWALHLDGVQPEVLAGQFRAGVRADDEDQHTLYARKAVKDAESMHGLRSHPQAVILEMDGSVPELRNSAITFLVIAFGGVNLAWTVAILLSRPVEKVICSGRRCN